jgi:hypothetical protein
MNFIPVVFVIVALVAIAVYIIEQTEQSDDGSFAQKEYLRSRALHDLWMQDLYRNTFT